MSPRPLGLELNPNARISILDSGNPPSFLVEAPIKGASYSSLLVSADNLPAAHAFLCATLIEGQVHVRIGEQDASELREIGLFAFADAIPQVIDYQFPMRESSFARDSVSLSDLHESAAIAFRPPLQLPTGWPKQALRFEPHRDGSVWAPFLVAGGSNAECGSNTDFIECRAPLSELDSEATLRHFEHEGFAILEGLLPAEHVAELGRYFQGLAAQGFLTFHDHRGTRRYIAHNHPVARFWHGQLNERVSRLAGRPTKPSYSFVSLYTSGGGLTWHTDRDQCEYTVTLLLDYAPLDDAGQSPWALDLRRRDGTIHSVHQLVGEALILKGRELEHGRGVLPDGHRSVSLLFHFVNEDFDGGVD